MTYEASVDWLFSQFPAYQKIGVPAYKPDLDNVLALCTHFGVNYRSLRCIHIAGTNGKGSTASYLASALQESGYKTGLFTSPHILDFRERIRVNGHMIPKEDVIAFCEGVQTAEIPVKPSFFEITWVMALMRFIAESCEVCVIETGLGGRLDATNIITPVLSIITNTGMDHTTILGDTEAQIASEKAGIIKAGIPVLIGEKKETTRKVFEEKARLESAPLSWSEDFHFDDYYFPRESYLRKNEQTVRAAIILLNKTAFRIPGQAIKDGFANAGRNTGFRARLQLIRKKPLTIVDAAHNAEGITELLRSIKQYDFDRLHVIYGASRDKDAKAILDLFPPDTDFYLCPFENPRSLAPEELKQLTGKSGKPLQVYPDVESAYLQIKDSVNETDMLLITGSFFLLSDFFHFFSEKDLPD